MRYGSSLRAHTLTFCFSQQTRNQPTLILPLHVTMKAPLADGPRAALLNQNTPPRDEAGDDMTDYIKA